MPVRFTQVNGFQIYYYQRCLGTTDEFDLRNIKLWAFFVSIDNWKLLTYFTRKKFRQYVTDRDIIIFPKHISVSMLKHDRKCEFMHLCDCFMAKSDTSFLIFHKIRDIFVWFFYILLNKFTNTSVKFSLRGTFYFRLEILPKNEPLWKNVSSRQ